MADPERRGERSRELERYRMLVENSNDVATIVDPDGTITYVSPSVRRVLGYEPDELIGEVGYAYQHPDDRDAVADAIEALRSDPDVSRTVETRFRRADGSWCWIEATMRNCLENDAIEGILVNSRDVSDRKDREGRLRVLAGEYRALLENVQDAVFLVDVARPDEPGDGGDRLDFRFERLSPSHEAVSGLTTEDVRGKTPRDAFGEDVGAEVEANYRRCVEAGEPITYEEELPMPDGTIVWQTTLAPMLSNGEVTRIVGIARDVTDRKAYERRLEDQRDDLEILNQVLRHDVRNELQLVTAYANSIADRVGREERDRFETILDSADRAIDLTETAGELADLLCTDTDDRRELDLRATLNRVLDGVRSAYPDALVTVDGPIPSVTVSADDMLDSVFHNVLTNAIRHNDGDVPEVVVSTTELEDAVRLRIADDGPGVPDDRKDVIFGKGEKGLDSPGTGLGLYLVQSLIDTYGGDVWVEDRAGGSPAENRPRAADEQGDDDPRGAVFVIELRKAD